MKPGMTGQIRADYRGRSPLWPGQGIALGVWVLWCLGVCGAAPQPAPIPEIEIIALEESLEEVTVTGRSSVSNRRLFKNTAREGLALISDAPEAPNRFRVLRTVFHCQQRLLAMDNNERTREALFATCEKLVEAPDQYAEARLDADLMLSERDLSARDATLEERAEALAALIERYRGTLAESKSLLMGALIVQKLDARELESHILYTLDEKYSDDHEVIEFRRRFLKISRLDLVFSGRHRRVDGSEVVFPSDTMGHMCLMVFWSKHKPGIEKYLEMMKAGLDKCPAVIDVFSFNVDELPDGGRSVLDEYGLEWDVMELPGGRRHQSYRSYAQGDPVAVLVNEYGLAVTRPEIVHGRHSSLDGSRISDGRYMAQLQSLLIGNFLIKVDAHLTSVPEEIQACFVPAPFRYRLTRDEAAANYRKAEALCADAAEQHPATPGLSEHRIVALLGLWNLTCDSEALKKAETESAALLATEPPADARVVPLFCQAKARLRADADKSESIVEDFLQAAGGDEAPAAAIAAAAILSLDAMSRELYDEYRSMFLGRYGDDPRFYAFSSFLRDRYHQYRLLKANHTLRERRARGYIVGHGHPWPTNSLPDIDLKNLDGTPFRMPAETRGKMTYLLFIEPPAGGGTNNFHIVRDSRGRVRSASGVHTVMGYAENLTQSHVNGDIRCVAAFLTDDADHVRYLVQTNDWNCEAVMVPGGLTNPMVRQLGILSADRFPNVYLLRRDGTIVWHVSGLRYKNEFGYPFAVLLAMKVHVEVCEVERAYRALERGNFKEAARTFAGPFELALPDRFGWHSPRCHGEALAYVGLKDWGAALDAIDRAIDAHKLRHFRGYGRRGKLEDWRKDAAKVEMKEPCDVICDLWATKAAILDELGRKDDAATVRKRLDEPVHEHSPYVYELFHEKLVDLNLIKR